VATPRKIAAGTVKLITDPVLQLAQQRVEVLGQRGDAQHPAQRYLPTNLSRPEIAGELSVSVHTVSTHLRRIYAKLQVNDRSSTVQRARELRLLAAGRAC
jgi:DNA-binding CsgD family transcriptional regulator